MVEAKVVGDDLRHWKGKIFGPVSIHLLKLELCSNSFLVTVIIKAAQLTSD